MKKAIRASALRRREEIGRRVRDEASARIAEHFLGLAARNGWRLVSCYVGYGTEVATENLIRELLTRGVRVAVPYLGAGEHRLAFSEIHDFGGELVVNPYGIREPAREHLRILPPGAMDAIVMPGCAFDNNGHRLGYGKGCYDRVLGEVRGTVPLVGLAFDEQIVDELPTENHDVPVDVIVTESGVHAVNQGCIAPPENIIVEEIP
jgi:5-formyltetrahydrofolate cyclo-ligase